ncbi:MAG: Calx-beta domain-containing protein [Gammaproteobacteria bacterium]
MTMLTRSAFIFALLFACASVQAGSIEFSSATYTVSEAASPATATITLKRTGGVAAGATVLVTSANGTATAGALADGGDYTTLSATVTWAAGDAADKTVSVTIVDDALVEGTETVALSLSTPTGDTIGAVSTATLSITDFEAGKLAFSAATYSVNENAGTATITVSRTSGSDGSATVKYATVNGTATAPDFYSAATGTLTFADAVTSQTFTVTIVDNSTGQADRNLTVTLSAPTLATLGEQVSATLTIVNDDVDFTPNLTKLTPVVEGITQGEVINLSQASPFNSTNTILTTINRIPELSITALEANQTTATGIVNIPVGDNTFHIFPYTAGQATSGSSAAIFLSQDQSGRMITDEGLQINFQPALANTSVLQFALNSMSLPKMVITKYGNLTVQRDQGPPPLDLNSEGKLVINNSFYDRYNLRPSITSSVAPAGSVVGVYLHPHPNAALPGQDFMQVIYTSDDGVVREQIFTTAPSVGAEYINAILAFNDVSDVRFEPFGISSFKYNGRTIRLYADFIVRRVNPTTYAGQTLKTGLFSAGDLNADGVEDFRMVYSTGDEQYFYILP